MPDLVLRNNATYLPIVLSLVHSQYNLWRHPIRRTHEAVSGALDTCAAEVRQLHSTILREKNVASLDVSVYAAQAVEVREASDYAIAYCRYFFFTKRPFVDLKQYAYMK